ncbi:helix-turn-helix transcriptional regulator [Allokutzneria sp. NRRL B-24872]|uniref:ArsR/SmtB family transcription factor n=1 Tax=Allokutzneria sp. NRRL B-24872 TaxID=1137961 RepID=UPI000A3A1CE3|nr:helix-turn-helix domain-containing protein [Allokutzneria sp. NRRL B-24872]
MRSPSFPTVSEITPERVFHALSDPVRLEIVKDLARLGAATCAEVTYDRPKSSMSHHFRVLREAGLVHSRGEGVHLINSLRREDLDERFPGLLDAVLGAIAR